MVAIAVHLMSLPTNQSFLLSSGLSCESIVSFIYERVIIPNRSLYGVTFPLTTVYVSLGGRFTPQYRTTRELDLPQHVSPNENHNQPPPRRLRIYFHFHGTPWDQQLCNEAAFAEIWCTHVLFRHRQLFQLIYLDHTIPSRSSRYTTTSQTHFGSTVDWLQQNGLHQHRMLNSRIRFVYFGYFRSSSYPHWITLKGNTTPT